MTRLHSALLAAVALLLVGGAVGVLVREEPPAPRTDLTRTLDSLRRATRASQESLVVYAREVSRLRGDSLRQAVLQRARARRQTLPPALLPPAPESLATPEEQHEDAERVLLVSDSACRVSLDSCRASCAGIQAERQYEAEETAHELQEARSEAKQARASRWGWGAVGALVGAVVVAVLVAIGD